MAKVENVKGVARHIEFKHACKTVVLLTLLVVTCGCQRTWVNELGRNLDNMAKGREKFGTISFSHPILVESKRDETSPFDFTLTTGPDDYYTDARRDVQGRMASSYQQVRESGVDLSFEGDISALNAYGAELRQYQQKLGALEAQNKLRTEAREFEAQKVMVALPDDATEEQLLEARSEAAKIRAGEDTIVLPAFPTPSVQPSNSAASASGGAADKKATDFLKLLADGTPALKISNRSAINTAAGDTVTEAIFTLLGNPAKTTQFKDKLMLFGVSMVSVAPGYVTKEGYTGELSVVCSYDYDIARRELLERIKKVEESKEEDGDSDLIELIEEVLAPDPDVDYDANWIPERYQKEFREEFTPLTAAVSPMTDVDALDLSSSIRNQTFSAMKISAALSYAGLAGRAEVFDKWAKKLEQDAKTRTSYAAVTSFSDSDHFGFRIRPRLKAIKDETVLVKTPGYVLEDQAFPVAVIVGIDAEDLQLGFGCDDGRLVAYEPYIEFHQTVNWLPIKRASFWNRLRGNELTETKRLEWLDSYNKANTYSDAKVDAMREDPDYYFEKYVDNRIALLGNQMLDMYSSQFLPMELLVGKPVKEAPRVTDPDKIFESWYDAPSTYVIDGENFEGQVVGANIGGQPCEVEVVGDSAVLVKFSGLPDPTWAVAQADLRIAQAEADIAAAGDDNAKKLAAEAEKKVAEKEMALAKASKLPEGAELKIVLITQTTEGSISAGTVRFTHNVTPK
ncbi:MAG: hypothetical protein ACYSWQ_07395 [Planctomycetota bacterium]